MAGTGPLVGLRAVELAGIGPVPHAAMMLADLGADVIRIDRPSGGPSGVVDPVMRGRRRVVANLKEPTAREAVLRIVERADVLLEGFRPGVTERLGIGPDICLGRNPRLVYARMTGWGQDGPMAGQAGHDINYISLTGVLHSIGRAGDRPVPPLNLVGDFGGGSMLLVAGVLAALWEAQRSGQGQVVDSAMIDGAMLLAQGVWGKIAHGAWFDQRGANLLDGAAPFYDTYVCADGRYVAVGAIEPQFYDKLLAGLGLSADELPEQMDRGRWGELKAQFSKVFLTRTRDAWARTFAGTDACVTPVLSFGEAPEDAQVAARGTLVSNDGVLQAAPAPRFSRTPAAIPRVAQNLCDISEIMADWGSNQDHRCSPDLSPYTPDQQHLGTATQQTWPAGPALPIPQAGRFGLQGHRTASPSRGGRRPWLEALQAWPPVDLQQFRFVWRPVVVSGARSGAAWTVYSHRPAQGVRPGFLGDCASTRLARSRELALPAWLRPCVKLRVGMRLRDASSVPARHARPATPAARRRKLDAEPRHRCAPGASQSMSPASLPCPRRTPPADLRRVPFVRRPAVLGGAPSCADGACY